MKYGNCLIGVILLAIKNKLRGRIVICKKSGCFIPHFAWLSENGIMTDYGLFNDLFPYPFHWVFFKGGFEDRNFMVAQARGRRHGNWKFKIIGSTKFLKTFPEN